MARPTENDLPKAPLGAPVGQLGPAGRRPHWFGYDQKHLTTHLRLLDAATAARAVLHIDPSAEPAQRHLARAKWMSERGYRVLINGALIARNLAVQLDPPPHTLGVIQIAFPESSL